MQSFDYLPYFLIYLQDVAFNIHFLLLSDEMLQADGHIIPSCQT